MRKSLLLLGFVLLLTACIKTPEEVKENLVIKAMTDGQWHMTSFSKAGVDKTAGFVPYRFQFKNNSTVEAINNGTIERTGTWSADPGAETITSSFSNTGEPLSLLNGT